MPDILTSAKGLGGGFPIGAMLTTAEIASAFSVGVHGTTFGGNPLACAVAGAVFDIVNTTEVLDGVRARHALFMEGLRTINARREVFADIRGEGVWIGCELKAPWQGKAAAVMTAASDAGLIVLMAGPDVVRIAPSLIISLDEILEGLARLETALGKALDVAGGPLPQSLFRLGEFVDRRPALAGLALVALTLLTHVVILVDPGFFSHDEWQKFDHIQIRGFWDYTRPTACCAPARNSAIPCGRSASCSKASPRYGCNPRRGYRT